MIKEKSAFALETQKWKHSHMKNLKAFQWGNVFKDAKGKDDCDSLLKK